MRSLNIPDTLVVDHVDIETARRLTVRWLPIESGCCGTVPDPSLDVVADAFRNAVFTAQILVDLGELPAGQYTYDSPIIGDDLGGEPFVEHERVEVQGTQVTIEVRDDHLKLLRAANTRFFDDGGRDIGLVIDPKRPYGDMTSFELDMASILGVKPEQGDEFSEAQMARFDALHEEMQPVLQVFLRRARLEPGRFERERRILGLDDDSQSSNDRASA